MRLESNDQDELESQINEHKVPAPTATNENVRGKRGAKKHRHVIHVVNANQRQKRKRMIHQHLNQRKRHPQQNAAAPNENNHPTEDVEVIRTFEEVHEHVDDEPPNLEQAESQQYQRHQAATNSYEQRAEQEFVDAQPEETQHHHQKHHEKVKIKHHHHHHHHNHVKEIIKKVPYPVEKIVKVPVEKEVIKKVPYPVEKIVHVPVEKVVYVPIEKVVEQIVHVPKPYPVEKIVQKIVHVPKPYPVVKPMPYPVEVKVPVEVPVHIEKKVPVPYKVEVEKKIPVPYKVEVEKKVPIFVHHPGHSGHHESSPFKFEHNNHKELHEHQTSHADLSSFPSQHHAQYGSRFQSLKAAALQNQQHANAIKQELLHQQLHNFGYDNKETAVGTSGSGASAPAAELEQSASENKATAVAADSKPFRIHVDDATSVDSSAEATNSDMQTQSSNNIGQMLSNLQPITIPFQVIQLQPMPSFQQPLGFSMPGNLEVNNQK